MARTIRSRWSHRFSIVFKFGEFSSEGSTVNSLWCFLNHASTLRGVWHLALSCWYIPSLSRKTIHIRDGYGAQGQMVTYVDPLCLPRWLVAHSENTTKTFLSPQCSLLELGPFRQLLKDVCFQIFTPYTPTSLCRFSIKRDSSEKKNPPVITQ